MMDAGSPSCSRPTLTAGSSPTPLDDEILSLASTHMRMTPAEAVTARPSNAAYSLSRGDELGTLEAGKRADVRRPRLRGLPRAGVLLRASSTRTPSTLGAAKSTRARARRGRKMRSKIIVDAQSIVPLLSPQHWKGGDQKNV